MNHFNAALGLTMPENIDLPASDEAATRITEPPTGTGTGTATAPTSTSNIDTASGGSDGGFGEGSRGPGENFDRTLKSQSSKDPKTCPSLTSKKSKRS